MKQQSSNSSKERYIAPSLRLINTLFEFSFLTSNTEPIIDDGQEHDWD
jgi:hypothetical protein